MNTYLSHKKRDVSFDSRQTTTTLGETSKKPSTRAVIARKASPRITMLGVYIEICHN